MSSTTDGSTPDGAIQDTANAAVANTVDTPSQGTGGALAPRRCAHCGAEFTSRSAKGTFCSASCRQLDYLRRKQGRTPANENRQTTGLAVGQNRQQKSGRSKARPCAFCALVFVPSRKGTVYCSHSCRQRAYVQRHTASLPPPNQPTGQDTTASTPVPLRPASAQPRVRATAPSLPSWRSPVSTEDRLGAALRDFVALALMEGWTVAEAMQELDCLLTAFNLGPPRDWHSKTAGGGVRRGR